MMTLEGMWYPHSHASSGKLGMRLMKSHTVHTWATNTVATVLASA